VAGALVALGLALAGCGIPIDRTPQQLSDADIGPLGNPAASATSSQDGQRVYFLTSSGPGDSFRLQAVSRDVPADALQVLSELFKGVTDAEKAPPLRLSSQIPVGTKLQSVELRADATVVVSVDDTIFRGAQNNLFAAIAQIVYTATSVPGIERVRLLVNGQPKQWPGDDGVERQGDLTPLAYPSLYPVNQPELPPVPSPTGPTTTPAPSTAPSSSSAAGSSVPSTESTAAAAATTTTIASDSATAAVSTSTTAPEPTTAPTSAPDDGSGG
jgi:hypothetical protein